MVGIQILEALLEQRDLTESQTQDALTVRYLCSNRDLWIMLVGQCMSLTLCRICLFQALVDGAHQTQMAAFLVLLRAKVGHPHIHVPSCKPWADYSLNSQGFRILLRQID